MEYTSLIEFHRTFKPAKWGPSFLQRTVSFKLIFNTIERNLYSWRSQAQVFINTAKII